MNVKIVCLTFLSISFLSKGRYAHRPKKSDRPYVIIWQDATKKYKLDDSHLRNIPLQTFDKNYFFANLIPSTIQFRYEPEKSVQGSVIKHMIEDLLKEIKSINHKTQVSFNHFNILKKLDFNFVTKTGFLVLKFKDYPFVLKLFIENAKTISHPLSKGFQERGLFIMGGCLRHFGGFTRVKNAQITLEKLKNSDWETRVTLPRKWFWIPEEASWINMNLVNLDEQEKTFQIPGIYGILCDAIDLDDHARPEDAECLALSTFLEYTIDPHVINFLKEKNSGKIAIIDTEHFPTLIGATEKINPAKTYSSWYFEMTKHYLSNNFFYLKDSRIKRQKNSKTYYAI